jgi:hypothetical protein
VAETTFITHISFSGFFPSNAHELGPVFMFITLRNATASGSSSPSPSPCLRFGRSEKMDGVSSVQYSPAVDPGIVIRRH